MKYISEFVDDRQKVWCIYCGGMLANLETNRDHVPSKALLREPYPTNLPVIEVCRNCNASFSIDEQYFATFLECVLSGSVDPSKQLDPAIKSSLLKNEKLRLRLEKSMRFSSDLFEGSRVKWVPEIDRIKRIVIKNARGHAYYEYGEPMLAEPTGVFIAPVAALTPSQWEQFEWSGSLAVWPEVGSRMMTRLIAGEDMMGGWIIVQQGRYRYTVTQDAGISVRTIIREYLATEVVWD